jgi:hypothetical protein
MILEDNNFNYRIWVSEPPQFQGIKDFRKPVTTQPVVIEVSPESYEREEGTA